MSDSEHDINVLTKEEILSDVSVASDDELEAEVEIKTETLKDLQELNNSKDEVEPSEDEGKLQSEIELIEDEDKLQSEIKPIEDEDQFQRQIYKYMDLLLSGMSSQQRLLTQKLIEDIIYHGRYEMLSESSAILPLKHNALEDKITPD